MHKMDICLRQLVLCTIFSIYFSMGFILQCDPGWQILPSLACFKVVNTTLTFVKALDACEETTATLVSIRSWADQVALYKSLKKDGISQAWIGLTDFGTENQFRWLSGDPLGVLYWAEGQPNDFHRTQDCVVMSTRQDMTNESMEKSWKDIHCAQGVAYVCMKDKRRYPTQQTFVPQKGVCPDKFFRLDNTCYYIYNKGTNGMNWPSARTHCQNMSQEADLASIRSQYQQDYFTAVMSQAQSALWLGLQRTAHKEYQWVKQNDFKFANWDENQPDGGLNTPCVAMTHSVNSLGRWSDEMCTAKLGFICESTLVKKAKGQRGVEPLFQRGKCDEGFVQLGEVCYSEMSQPQTRDAANKSCTQLHSGGYLVTPHLASEVAFLRTMMRRYEWTSVWVNYQVRRPDNATMYIRADGQSQVGINDLPINLGSMPVGPKWTCLLMGVSTGLTPSDCVSTTSPSICAYYMQNHPLHPRQENNLVCPSAQWIRYGDQCYLFKEDKKNAVESMQSCLNLGAKAASIHSIYEQQFVEKNARQKGMNLWLGLKMEWMSLMTRGALLSKIPLDFTWSDNTPVDYLHLGVNELSSTRTNNEQIFVQLNQSNGLWSIAAFSDKTGYVCQQKAELPKPVVTTPRQQLPSCPSHYAITHNTDCYRIETANMKTWRLAETDCQQDGGHLASVPDDDTNRFLSGQIKSLNKPEFWIGLSDLDSLYENAWIKWTDNTRFTYPNFADGQQDNAFGGEDCVAMTRKDGQWHDLHCTLVLPYMCVFHRVPVVVPTQPPVEPDPDGYVCPPGFQTFANRCYKLVTETALAWEQANTYCKSFVPKEYKKRSTLAVISNQSDNDYIYSLLSGSKGNLSAPALYWIGARVISKQIHQVNQAPVTFTQFNFSTFSSKRENTCAAMNGSPSPHAIGYWSGMQCSQKLPFICHAPKIPDSGHYIDKKPLVSCPHGYTPFNSSQGLKCYYILKQANWTFAEAVKSCEKNSPLSSPSAHLLSIEDSYELGFLAAWFISSGLSLDRPVWLGLKVDGSEEWRWVDGKLVKFTFWSSPPDRPQGCYAFVQRFTKDRFGMAAKACTSKFYAVCKWDTLPTSLQKRDGLGPNCRHRRHGADYDGPMNKTVNGTSCIRWDLINNRKVVQDLIGAFSAVGTPGLLAGAANLCRNPNGIRDRPFCYTTRGSETMPPILGCCDVPQCLPYGSDRRKVHHGHGGVVAMVVILVLALASIILGTGYCLWRRSNTARGFIPYFRQSDPSNAGGASSGTFFHNPIYTPANC